MNNERMPDEERLPDWLGPELAEAADKCLDALAGVDTNDVNLRDHADAWRAIDGFAAQVIAAERKRVRLLAVDFREYLYRVSSQVPFEHSEWARERGAALLAALNA